MPPVKKVKCNSVADIEYELRPIREKLAVPETEDSWDAIAKSISHLTLLIQAGSSNFSNELAHALRSLSRPLSSAILSERSRLSGVAIDLVNQSAELLGKSFDILIPIFLPTLLTVCARPNKVFISRGKTCIINIVQATQSPSILGYLVESAKDKNVTLRLSAAEAALACLNSFNPPDLEKEARGKEVESIIKSTATDASADVRKVGRQLFEAYKILLPQRVEKFTTPLSPTMKKYLDIRSRVASTSSQHSNPPSNPPSRPTSSQSMHSVNSLNAIIRPRSTVPSSNSTTTLPPLTKSASSRMVDTRHSRTASSSSTQPLSRSDSAPLTSKPSSTSIRPLVGPSRPRPLSGASRPTDNREMPPPQIIPIRPVSSLSDNGPMANSHKLSSAPQRPGVFQPPAAALPVTPGGPLRPMFMREPVDQEGQPIKPRVVGGARRVPKPQPPPEEPVQPPPKAVAPKQKSVDPAKSTSRAGSVSAPSRPGSATSSKNEARPEAILEKKASTNKDASSSSRLTDAATKSKTSAASNSNSKSTSSIVVSKKPESARNTNATSKMTTATTASATTTRRSATSATANSTSRLTAPTQAQLARQKSITSAAQKTDATKVARGNSNRGGAIPPTKTQLPPKVTARKPSLQAHRARSKTPGVAKPPVEPTIAAKFPLPISRPSSPSPSVQTCPTDDENKDKDNDSEVPVSETEAETEEEVEDEEAQVDGDGVEPEIKVEEEDVQIPIASSEAEHPIKSEEDSESELESEPTVIISPCDLPKEHSSQSPHNSPPPTNSPATPGLDPSIPKFLICSPSPSSSSSSQSGDDPSTPKASFPLTPNSNHNNQYPTVPETPISSLLASIQMGFEFNSPAPPFDPDQTSSLGGMLVYDKCEPLAIGHR